MNIFTIFILVTSIHIYNKICLMHINEFHTHTNTQLKSTSKLRVDNSHTLYFLLNCMI